MRIPLQNLIEMDEPPEDAYDPLVEHAPMDALMRQPKNDRDLIQARAKSVVTLLSHGMEAELDDAEDSEARKQFHSLTQKRTLDPHSLMRPAVIMKLSALLSEYDYEVVRDAEQIRTYVTNRLIEESDSKMPGNIRMQALKALGAITEVGLFTERSEITVKTMPLENLEAALHARLIDLLPQDYNIVTTDQLAAC